MRRWEKDIRNSILAAENLGWKLQPGEWIDDMRECCCALGACIIAKGDYIVMPDDPFDLVQSYFNVNEAEIESFIAGFDGENNPNFDYQDSYEFGKEMRTLCHE